MKVGQVSTNQILQKKEKKPAYNFDQEVLNELQIKGVSKEEDKTQLMYILGSVLQYPLQKLAEFHQNCMKLGGYDYKEQESSHYTQTKQSILKENVQKQYCPCCGFVKQDTEIVLSADIGSLVNIGTSTLLYFNSYYILAILMVIMLLVYSIFAVITNVIAVNSTSNLGLLNVVDYLTISLSSKQLNPTQTNKSYYFISCWLGLGMIIIWIITLFLWIKKINKIVQQYDDKTTSASDFSICLQGVPYNIQKQDLQKAFDQYHINYIVNHPQFGTNLKKKIKIAQISVGKPHDLYQQQADGQIKQMNKDIQQIRNKIVALVKQRQKAQTFTTPKEEREKIYQQFMAAKEKLYKKHKEIMDKNKKVSKEQQTHLTTAFITFQTSHNKTMLVALSQKPLLYRIFQFLCCCKQSDSQFSFQFHDKIYRPKMKIAPQPQDIIWQKIGHSQWTIFMYRFATFTATVVLLGISFAAVYGLIKLQVSAGDNRTISIAISVLISFINFLLGQMIRWLTLREKDYVRTILQTSLSIKIILAQLVNTIIIPVVAAYKIKFNVYQASGLVDNVFILSLTLSFTTPLMYLCDPYTMYLKFMKCIISNPQKKLQINQKIFNSYYQGPQFEVGFNSVYSVSLFAFCCFYISLQPIISVFALCGYLLMYWIEKYLLFNRYRRPIPGTDFTFQAIFRIITLCPIIFCLGSLTWANFSPDGSPSSALLPNLIALGCSVIMFLVPFKTITALFSDTDAVKQQIYSNQWIFLSSDYKMVNPVTQQQACLQHAQLVKKKIQQLMSKQNNQQNKKMIQKFNQNMQKGQMYQRGNNNNNDPIFNLIGGMAYNPFPQQQNNPSFNRPNFNMPMNFGPTMFNPFANPYANPFARGPVPYHSGFMAPQAASFMPPQPPMYNNAPAYQPQGFNQNNMNMGNMGNHCYLLLPHTRSDTAQYIVLIGQLSLGR